MVRQSPVVFLSMFLIRFGPSSGARSGRSGSPLLGPGGELAALVAVGRPAAARCARLRGGRRMMPEGRRAGWVAIWTRATGLAVGRHAAITCGISSGVALDRSAIRVPVFFARLALSRYSAFLRSLRVRMTVDFFTNLSILKVPVPLPDSVSTTSRAFLFIRQLHLKVKASGRSPCRFLKILSSPHYHLQLLRYFAKLRNKRKPAYIGVS